MVARLLILGGTGEAAALARAATLRFGPALEAISSLAGRTGSPAPVAGQVRIGGFGGAEGLARYLLDDRIECLIDATHPFAAQISRHAREAAEEAGIPRLMLRRPAWRRHPLDRWIEVGDVAGAGEVLAKVGRRAWLTVGSRDLAAFDRLPGLWFLVRTIDPPVLPVQFGRYELLLARGPFNLEEERRTIRRHAIDVLVTKASGGAATAPKLVAAREAGVPVIMVRRPPPEPGRSVASIDAALDWLSDLLGRGCDAAVSDRVRG